MDMQVGVQEMPKLPRCKADDEDMERLHQAARRGNAELCSRLIAQGISVSVQNKFGCTALHLACRKGHVPVLRALAQYNPPLSNPWHGLRPVHLAVQSGHNDVLVELIAMAQAQELDIEAFLGEPDDYETAEVGGFDLAEPTSQQTALHWAMGMEHEEIYELLLENGASLLARDKRGRTPLHCAIHYKQAKYVTDLLRRGASMSAPDMHGRSALHLALELGHVSFAYEIVEQEAKTVGDGGTSALFAQEDEHQRIPLLLAIEIADLPLIGAMLPMVDIFKFQRMTFHDARMVYPDRIHWKDPDRHVDPRKRDDERDLVVRLLQRRLDEINHTETETRTGKRGDRGRAGTGTDSRGRRT